MKSKLFITCIFLLNLLVIEAQSSGFNSKGLEVTRGDLEQNVFNKDSTANALVLYEIGNSFVDKNSFKLNTEIRRKLKIFNRKGFDKATEEIYLYKGDNGSKVTVKDIKATVYNIENGDVNTVKLSKNDIIKDVYNDRFDIVKFTFPNIKEGSVINYSYVLESPFMFNYKGWQFQDNIPKLYSEYKASIPGNWEYHIKLVGEQKLAVSDAKVVQNCLDGGNGAYANCSNYRYVMKDIPAFVAEDYMTTANNYLSRIEYELKTFRRFDGTKENFTKSWKNTDDEIKRGTSFGNQLKKLGATRDLLDQSIINEDNPTIKAQGIYKFVQENYTWNESFTLFNDVSLKTLLDEKSGSASEINILLHNLLKDNDINVNPLLLSTRENGFITKLFPNITDFNYMIVRAEINGEVYLLDATDDYLSFGQIPYRCLNQYGRLLDLKDESEWYDIDVKDYSLNEYGCELNLNADDILEGNINFKSTGYHSLLSRKSYFKNPKSYLEALENKHNTMEISDFQVFDTEKTGDNFNSSFQIKTTPDLVGNTIYLNPFLFKFFTENPFKLQERSYPIDFGYKDTFVYKFKLQIDDSYTITEIPELINLKLPDNKGSFLLTAQQNENLVTLYFKLSFNESIYDPAFYEALKTIMNKVVDTQNNSLIVLEKKE